MLRNTNKEQALLVAKRLQNAVEREPFDGEQESQPNKKLTISIGVAVFPENIQRSSKPVEVADLALYRAKRFGGNQVCCFGDDQCAEWQYPGDTAINN
jgi:diguanylate cyclase